MSIQIDTNSFDLVNHLQFSTRSIFPSLQPMYTFYSCCTVIEYSRVDDQSIFAFSSKAYLVTVDLGLRFSLEVSTHKTWIINEHAFHRGAD